MTSTDRLNEAFANHMAERGVRHPPGSDEFQAGYAEMTGHSLDDIAVGWTAVHGTDRYENGDHKGGCVVDVWDDPERGRMVTVIEDRMVERKLIVRRFDWPVRELDPLRCEPTGMINRHSAAKTICAAIGFNVKGGWSFDRSGDEFLLGAAYALTEPERALRVGAVAATCGGVHCVDEGGECFESRDHLGVCCSCGTTVPGRVAGKVRGA